MAGKNEVGRRKKDTILHRMVWQGHSEEVTGVQRPEGWEEVFLAKM